MHVQMYWGWGAGLGFSNKIGVHVNAEKPQDVKNKFFIQTVGVGITVRVGVRVRITSE